MLPMCFCCGISVWSATLSHSLYRHLWTTPFLWLPAASFVKFEVLGLILTAIILCFYISFLTCTYFLFSLLEPRIVFLHDYIDIKIKIWNSPVLTNLINSWHCFYLNINVSVHSFLTCSLLSPSNDVRVSSALFVFLWMEPDERWWSCGAATWGEDVRASGRVTYIHSHTIHELLRTSKGFTAAAPLELKRLVQGHFDDDH